MTDWPGDTTPLPHQAAEDRLGARLAGVVGGEVSALRAERDALAAAVDRVRRRHPRGDEEASNLAPGLWCPTCGRERTDNGYGGCPDRNALVSPDRQIDASIVCGGCGTAMTKDASEGWRFTDAPWCPKCAWLA